MELKSNYRFLKAKFLRTDAFALNMQLRMIYILLLLRQQARISEVVFFLAVRQPMLASFLRKTDKLSCQYKLI
jgi:hypothetical protein